MAVALQHHHSNSHMEPTFNTNTVLHSSQNAPIRYQRAVCPPNPVSGMWGLCRHRWKPLPYTKSPVDSDAYHMQVSAPVPHAPQPSPQSPKVLRPLLSAYPPKSLRAQMVGFGASRAVGLASVLFRCLPTSRAILTLKQNRKRSVLGGIVWTPKRSRRQRLALLLHFSILRLRPNFWGSHLRGSVGIRTSVFNSKLVFFLSGLGFLQIATPSVEVRWQQVHHKND
mmetsp:Transcript_28116/g.47782  ORF Transcript_28116/g.47782 Transcript_28116/m.47782 type:complete len:225 (+) Transcript_28116:1141-1815(+)